MANLQEISGYLPQWAQDLIIRSGNSTYSDHLYVKQKRLKKASDRFPYGVFNPDFINVSATNDLIGVSAVYRPPYDGYPNGRTDLIIQYMDEIGNFYTEPTSASPQPTDMCRFKETPNGNDCHNYPSSFGYIKPWEVVTELWSINDDADDV